MAAKSPSDKKLWIGNLDKRLTEYNLLKIIQCYGEIENFQYLFHTVGPNKGEPRTYCFVEYKRKEDAGHALRRLNGKVVLSQALRVRWAEETDISLPKKKLDSGETKIADVLSVDDKIKAIEGKLKLMANSNDDQMKPIMFHGKHPLLAKGGQGMQAQKARQKHKRRTYPSSKR